MRMSLVCALVLALGGAAAADKKSDSKDAISPEVLVARLAEATRYPTAHVAKLAERGGLVAEPEANVPFPLVLYVAATVGAFEFEVLEGDALDGRTLMAGLLDDVKREHEEMPEVASMLTPATISKLEYDPPRRRGSVVFVVGKRLRLRSVFETEGDGEALRVTRLWLPDSGWGARLRSDRTWEQIHAWPSGPVRGIYGGMPTTLLKKVGGLEASGVTAVWIGERGITTKRIRRLREEPVAVYAEFNTLHCADYLNEHPDAAPVGPDGKRAEAPHGWQGICPTHEAYRAWRMRAFRRLITEFAVDGVWLDYHHAHASWERAEPVLPDTCFCPRCLAAFQRDTGVELGDGAVSEKAKRLLGELRKTWVDWRCGVFTDWVRAFDAIRKEERRNIALGSFHCPWTAEERDHALREKLAIDLRAQSQYLDVLSPMPYHARFGHAEDPAWISRQTTWLGEHLGLKGHWGETTSIWPIVQLRDWGETVPAAHVGTVLEHGLRAPSRGVIVFTWGGIKDDPAKLEAMRAFFLGRR